MEASDTFPALVSVSGMMQADIWDKRKTSGNVSFFQITGEKDDVVPKNSDGSAKYAKVPPIEDVMAYWVETNDADMTEKINIGKSSVLTRYTNTGTHVQIWDLLVKDGGHSWYSEKINGFDTNDVILDFFESLD
jgi:poly(3-hydroxybutyrate) depolymerase